MDGLATTTEPRLLSIARTKNAQVQFLSHFGTKLDVMLSQTSKCLNTNKTSYHLDTSCIRLSNMADDAFNGLYKKYNDTLYVHTTPAKKLILKYAYEDGWNGCHGNETLMNPGCFPYRRWAYIADLPTPIT